VTTTAPTKLGFPIGHGKEVAPRRKEPPRFLLAGNGSYQNRGCEAIVRGTTAILRRTFGADAQFSLAEFGAKNDLLVQRAAESDHAISHIRLNYDKYSSVWLMDQLERRLGVNTHGQYSMLRHEVARVRASLQVGGDNYSLDYGRPDKFFALDDYLIRQRIPVFIWGGSVGPFDLDPEVASLAPAHLNKLDGIFVRESRTFDYLRRIKASGRARLVADPAFAMAPEAPRPEHIPSLRLEQAPIGLNFSPLMARFVTGGNMDLWTGMCTQAIVSIMRRAGENVLLVPHVFESPHNDDGEFLAEVAVRVRLETGTSVNVMSRHLSAAQIKWIISRCSVFVGARTHATIAAFSTGVPTLSLAYSIKARGLNQDIFGSLDYCLDPKDMSAEVIANRTLDLLKDAPRVRDHLASRTPALIARAFDAGDYLAEFLYARDQGREAC